MEDKLSLPMGEFIFLVCFRKLTNCYISKKHTKLRAMTAGDTSQTIPVQITTYFVLYCFIQIEHVRF